MARALGFEPRRRLISMVLETIAFNRSAKHAFIKINKHKRDSVLDDHLSLPQPCHYSIAHLLDYFVLQPRQ